MSWDVQADPEVRPTLDCREACVRAKVGAKHADVLAGLHVAA
jgi:hypothetical protein